MKEKSDDDIVIPMGEETFNEFDRLIEEYVKQNMLEEVDIASQKETDYSKDTLNDLDVTASADTQYNQLANIFLNRKSKRKLARYKKKGSFSSKLYKNIGL